MFCIFHLSFEKGGAKELEWGVGIGFDRTDMPASIGVWATVRSASAPWEDITNARWKHADRTSRVFLFIVKSEL